MCKNENKNNKKDEKNQKSLKEIGQDILKKNSGYFGGPTKAKEIIEEIEKEINTERISTTKEHEKRKKDEI